MDTAWILGQDTERPLALTGWISTHPVTGEDVAHLLIYPLGHGVADKMRTLATTFGLVPTDSGQPAEVPPDSAYATITDGEVRLHHGDAAWLHRPVDDEWAQIARDRGYIILTCGQDGYTHRGLDAHLDRYLARHHRTSVGVLRLA